MGVRRNFPEAAYWRRDITPKSDARSYVWCVEDLVCWD